mmetsp:Transcript_29122/g.69340  ORF Transcript_29122/g.69340 Transcript_29122/m.69340 type:complete len:112 (-) Transcript_29122:29-364(-)
MLWNATRTVFLLTFKQSSKFSGGLPTCTISRFASDMVVRLATPRVFDLGLGQTANGGSSDPTLSLDGVYQRSAAAVLVTVFCDSRLSTPRVFDLLGQTANDGSSDSNLSLV